MFGKYRVDPTGAGVDPRRAAEMNSTDNLRAGLVMTKAASKFLRVVRLRNAVNTHSARQRSARFDQERIELVSTARGILLEERGIQGANGTGRRVVSYDDERLIRYETCCVAGKAFNEPFLIHQAVVVLGLTCALAYGLRAGAVHVTDTDVASAASMFAYFSAIQGFVFGFFIFEVISRWWRIRTDGLGVLWIAIDELIFNAAVWYPGTSPDDATFKWTVLRYCLVVHALVFKEHAPADPKKPRAPQHKQLDDLVARNLLSDKEALCLHGVEGKALAVVSWLSRVYRARSHSWGDERAMRLEMLETSCRRAVEALNVIDTHISVQLPMSLVHLLGIMMKVQLLFLTVSAGLGVAHSLQGEVKNYVELASNLLFALVTPICFQALLEIADDLKNPFGDDADDFPQFAYHQHMREMGKGVIRGAERWNYDLVFAENTSRKYALDQKRWEEANAENAAQNRRTEDDQEEVSQRRASVRMARRSSGSGPSGLGPGQPPGYTQSYSVPMTPQPFIV